MLACVDKNIAFISVALWLLNSQWKMHHCIVLCLVLSSLCSLQAYNYAEHLYNILLFLPGFCACKSRSDCARSRAYFMVISCNIATFTPEYRLKHVSTRARNHENSYSTTDYHLKWFSLESEADETAVSEEGSSSNLYSCEDGESSVSESEDEQSSEPERDYLTRSRCSASGCKLYARDFSPMHSKISPTKHSET